MSVEFEPVRLGPRRRRTDPVLVGVIVLVAALAIAVVKPWESSGPGGTAGAHGPSIAAVAATAPATRGSAPPSVSVTPGTAPASRPPTRSPPTWGDIGPVVTHDALGVMAILVGQGAALGQATPPRYAERWTRSTPDADGVETALVQPDDQSIVALGVTVRRGQLPQDLRIWRVHQDGELEWIDAHAIVGRPKNGALLFVRPGGGSSAYTPWTAGRYRVDLLMGGVVQRIAVLIPDRFGNDPPPDDPPPIQAGLVRPTASDPSNVLFGLFATVDGTGVPLPAAAGRSLGEAAAWLEVTPIRARTSPVIVAEAYLPRATGLGVMLTSHAAIRGATVRRLAPDAGLPAQPMLGGVSYTHGGTPWLVFLAPSGGAWPAGVYALTVSWADTAGIHTNTWHVELRPGPIGADS